MSNLLHPNIVRAVVREVLASKNAVLDLVLQHLVETITPIVQREANTLLLAAFDPDPRESLIEELQSLLTYVNVRLKSIAQIDNETDLAHEFAGQQEVMCQRLTETLRWLQKRRDELNGVQAVAMREGNGKAVSP